MHPNTTAEGPTLLVTLEDHEGALHVDALTGLILTPTDDRPDWSEGFAAACLAERVAFYEKAIGPDLGKVTADETVVDARDLDWVGIHPDSLAEVTFPHDVEYRAEKVAEVLGLDLSATTEDGDDVIPISDQLEAAGVDMIAEAFEPSTTTEAVIEDAAERHGQVSAAG